MHPVFSVQDLLSSASTCCWRASLAFILATPSFLANTPSSHPIRVSCSTIIRLGWGCTSNLARASLVMHSAAPRLLANRPTHLPIGVSISAIVRVCRPGWCYWHDWCHWHDRSHWHDRLGTTNMVNPM